MQNIGTDLADGLTDTKSRVNRTGGGYAAKYGKKSYRGILPRIENTLNSSFVSHEIRLYGAETTLNCRRQGALSYGGSYQ